MRGRSGAQPSSAVIGHMLFSLPLSIVCMQGVRKGLDARRVNPLVDDHVDVTAVLDQDRN
jgi:hypothetical protein